MNRDGFVVCWHERPLAADEAAVEVDMKSQDAWRLFKALHSASIGAAIATAVAPGQVFTKAGRRLYWPTEADRRRLESLCPGVSVDAVPWASLHAELEAATPNYIAERDWIAATGPAILIVIEELRAAKASEQAMRNPPREAARDPGGCAGEPSPYDARALAAWSEYREAAEQLEEMGKAVTQRACFDHLTRHDRIESCRNRGFDTWKKLVQRGKQLRPAEGLTDALNRGHSVVRASSV